MRASLILIVAVFVLGACELFETNPRQTTSLIFDKNGFEGHLSMTVAGNASLVVCETKAPWDASGQEHPACNGVVDIPKEFLPLTAVNSPAGAKFRIGFGDSGWNTWPIIVKCQPDCAEEDYSNLTFTVDEVSLDSQFDKAHFVLADRKISMRTMQVEYASAGVDIGNVLSFDKGLGRGPNAATTLIYPGVYQVGYAERDQVTLIDPQTNTPVQAQRRSSAFLVATSDGHLEWRGRTTAAGTACEAALVFDCRRIRPTAVAMCVPGLSCPLSR